jgi:glycosyltransferase involved in cell wall biosynthesis
MYSTPDGQSDFSPPPSRVVVLMSTYNGEKFVVEQLHSVLDQLPVDGRILVRDDGSSDATVERVASVTDPRIAVVRGENLGFAASFLTLLKDAPGDAGMIMFADQDDVWLPRKVERAWKALSALRDRPALYCSAQMLADEQLRPLHATQRWPRDPSFQNALSENVVTGCTAALNPAAAALLRGAGVPQQVRFHDWWMYLVVSAFGTVVFDPEPTLLYRQHGANQIGHGAGWWGRQRRILAFLHRHDWVGILLGQVTDLRKHYGSRLTPVQLMLVDSYFTSKRARARPRWRLVVGLRRWRQFRFGELTFRALIAAHLLGIHSRRARPPGR